MKKLDVSLTEEMILNYAALPEELYGWRRYRIEYGGCNESCIHEETIYLPPYADFNVIEHIMRQGQKLKRDKSR